MNPRRLFCVGAAVLLPDTASAHEAFGDLGPFYTHMLHPAVDPAQALVLVGAGALLTRQPIATVKLAYAVLVVAGALAVSILVLVPFASPGLWLTATTTILLGLLTISGMLLPRWMVCALCAAVAVLAASALDMTGTGLAVLQKAIGGALGLAVTVLFFWGFLDFAVRRIHPVSAAVVGSWIAAVGLLILVLPS